MQRISCHCHFCQVLVYIKSFNEGKKLHTDECYVCIISFIRSVLAFALALMVLALLTSLFSVKVLNKYGHSTIYKYNIYVLV